MNADTLRDKFLIFFKSKRHKIVESDSLVPTGDPTVLFTPAGMNQFKKEFLGFDSGFKRAATCQRCLRTDDLDKVGKTPGHHTFFEMLGNFSFGDYFKEEAISYAWEFLTQELKISIEKLWVSVYRDDAEAFKIWKDKIKVGVRRIIKLGDKENFWPSEAKVKGPNGPCGPCSEIFFDQGKDVGCKKPDCNPSCNCGRFVEVWNLVFTQFNRKVGAILEPLPKRNIDTGMGLERLTAAMQGLPNNFETDLFQPIVKEVGSKCPSGKVANRQELIYAIADHIRAIAFAIYDGVLPSNESRGYVVRKLIRKSSLHLLTLGFKSPFLYKLVPTLTDIMNAPYPELQVRRENISEVILAEEKSFLSILESSQQLFAEAGFLKSDSVGTAHKAFQLYDTYGIPLELTKGWLDKHGIMISPAAFNQELAKQKTRSKLQSAMKGDVFDTGSLHLDVKQTKFLGYQDYSLKAKIIKLIKDNTEIKKINRNEEAKLILDKTVFYPESGGQIGDRGEFIKGKNIFEVYDTQKVGKLIIHIGRVKEGSFKKNDFILATINTERRLSIARNHTATHLLQAALRKVLGNHVRQQGSLVAQDRLRFDFTHFKDIEKRELERIEEIVNNYIIANYSLKSKEVSLSEAKRRGALAFFAEKYKGKVRVVSINDISVELCGGTHLNFTGQIGLFKITQESSVASGIRRIEAITAGAAYKAVKEEEEIIGNISSALGVSTDKITREIERRLNKIKELEKQLNLERLGEIKNSLPTLIQAAPVINDIKIICHVLEDVDIGGLRRTVDMIKEKTNKSIIVLGSQNQGRAWLVMGITLDLVQKGLDASRLILDPAQILGGSGGGRKDFAQAGGNKPENFPMAFERLKDMIRTGS